jgi:hypothetical protein
MPIVQAVREEPVELPGENPASNPRAVMGGNMPPPEEAIPAEFRAALLEEKAEFFTLLDNYLGVGDPNMESYKSGAVDRAKCSNDEELGKCGEVQNALRKLLQIAERTKTTVKAPYLLAGNLVQAEFNTLNGRLKAGFDAVQSRMDQYANDKREAERKRLQEEADERARLEALAKENNLESALPPPAPPPPAKVEPVRSDGGATVSAGVEWHSQVEDYKKAFNKVKDDAGVRAAIDAAVKRIVKATKGQQPLPGVRIWDTAKASARGR